MADLHCLSSMTGRSQRLTCRACVGMRVAPADPDHTSVTAAAARIAVRCAVAWLTGINLTVWRADSHPCQSVASSDEIAKRRRASYRMQHCAIYAAKQLMLPSHEPVVHHGC